MILVTASIAGLRPRPGLSAYVASKGGAIALVKALALELAPFKVRVNAICPVAVRTPMITKFGFGDDEAEAEERFVATIPLGRLTTPEDIAEAARYLASDAAGDDHRRGLRGRRWAGDLIGPREDCGLRRRNRSIREHD